jgi:hypothetical protein
MIPADNRVSRLADIQGYARRRMMRRVAEDRPALALDILMRQIEDTTTMADLETLKAVQRGLIEGMYR